MPGQFRELLSRDSCTVGIGEEQVDVLRVPVVLHQVATEVTADRLKRCLPAGTGGRREDRMAVLRHENQVGVQQETTVSTSANVVCLSHGPNMVCGMQLRYRYRLDPTPAQRQALACAFGCARVVYNDGLRLREDAYRAGLRFVGGWSCPDRSSRSPPRPRNGRGSGRSLPWLCSSRWPIWTAPTATTSGT